MKVRLSDVISKRIYDENCGWRDMTDEEQEMYLQQIKNVLRGLARNHSSKYLDAVDRMSTTNLPGNCGKFTRIDTEEFTPFQDYIEEVKVIKNIIRRECY